MAPARAPERQRDLESHASAEAAAGDHQPVSTGSPRVDQSLHPGDWLAFHVLSEAPQGTSTIRVSELRRLLPLEDLTDLGPSEVAAGAARAATLSRSRFIC